MQGWCHREIGRDDLYLQEKRGPGFLSGLLSSFWRIWRRAQGEHLKQTLIKSTKVITTMLRTSIIRISSTRFLCNFFLAQTRESFPFHNNCSLHIIYSSYSSLLRPFGKTLKTTRFPAPTETCAPGLGMLYYHPSPAAIELSLVYHFVVIMLLPSR